MFFRLRNFLVLPLARTCLIAEATSALLSSYWLVRHKTFRSYARTLGRPHPGEYEDVSNHDMSPHLLGQVRWALLLVNRLMGGRFTCLMVGIASKRMLNRRGQANTLVLGVRPAKGDDDDPFGAHAWLRAGRFIVVGFEERVGHIPVASYHSDPTHE